MEIRLQSVMIVDPCHDADLNSVFNIDRFVYIFLQVSEIEELVSEKSGKVGGTMVICTIERMHAHPSIARKTASGSDYVDLEAFKPISRLGATDYGRVAGVFSIDRPKV